MSDKVSNRLEEVKRSCICSRCLFCSPSPTEPAVFCRLEGESVEGYAEGLETCTGFSPKPPKEAGE